MNFLKLFFVLFFVSSCATPKYEFRTAAHYSHSAFLLELDKLEKAENWQQIITLTQEDSDLEDYSSYNKCKIKVLQGKAHYYTNNFLMAQEILKAAEKDSLQVEPLYSQILLYQNLVSHKKDGILLDSITKINHLKLSGADRKLHLALQNKPQSSKVFQETVPSSLATKNIVEKINLTKIGVVLPLSGEKKNFAQSVLKGIQFSLGENIELIVKDDENNSLTGSKIVQDLIAIDNVALIIGGLFSPLAQAEAIESLTEQTPFISLSPVLSSKIQKNHLLFELIGSVRSQMNALEKDKLVEKLGNRLAVVYANTEEGRNFYEEVKAVASALSLNVVGGEGIESSTVDFRKDVGNLKALPEFDWVFLPVNSMVALQLIPVFRYLDMNSPHFVGGPSWKTKSLMKSYLPMQKIHFVADEDSLKDDDFKAQYLKEKNEPAGYLEYLGYEAVSMAQEALKEAPSRSSRSSLSDYFKELGNLHGYSSAWHLEQGVWLKEMKTLGIENDKIVPFN